MSNLRVNFLNWKPDTEDVGNDGLTVATNVVHDTEGYKATHLISATAFSTTGGLADSVATVCALSSGLPCVIAQPVGAQDDLFVAWLSGSPPTLHVGLNGITSTSDTTGYPLSFSTAYVSNTATPVAIFAFDVCEYADKIFFNVEARMGTLSPNTTQSLKYSAYMDF